MPPFFTIITSTYNAAATLPRLLDSLASQTCQDFNWIVQDGASSDSTMQIVEQYRDRLPAILANSSKDSGIYDAWNKAIDRWQDKMGEWVLFLGADDKFLDEDTLETAKNKIVNLEEYIIFAAGDIIILDRNNHIVHKTILTNNAIAFKSNKLSMTIPHPSLFTRKKVIIQYKFDSSFKIAGDYDFLIKTWQRYDQLVPLHFIVTQMASGGISSNANYRKLLIRENFRIFLKIKSIRGIIICFDEFFYKYKIILKNILQKNKIGSLFFSFIKKAP